MAAGLQDWVDFGVICGLLLLNAAVGFVQEFQAGSIVDELKKTLALKALVLRDGVVKEVDAPEVVPGDILQVEEVGPERFPYSEKTCAASEAVRWMWRSNLLLLPRVRSFLRTAASLPKMPSSRLISLPLPVNRWLWISIGAISASRLPV